MACSLRALGEFGVVRLAQRSPSNSQVLRSPLPLPNMTVTSRRASYAIAWFCRGDGGVEKRSSPSAPVEPLVKVPWAAASVGVRMSRAERMPVVRTERQGRGRRRRAAEVAVSFLVRLRERV